MANGQDGGGRNVAAVVCRIVSGVRNEVIMPTGSRRNTKNLIVVGGRLIGLLAVLGDDEAAEGFVVSGGWGGKGRVPFLKPFVVLDGITKISVGLG